jgi:hypothetical protein
MLSRSITRSFARPSQHAQRMSSARWSSYLVRLRIMALSRIKREERQAPQKLDEGVQVAMDLMRCSSLIQFDYLRKDYVFTFLSPQM